MRKNLLRLGAGLPAVALLSACVTGAPGGGDDAQRGAFLLGSNAAQLDARCEQALSDSKARLGKMRTLALADVHRSALLDDWNHVNEVLDTVSNTADLQANTDTSADVRRAAQKCTEKVSSLYSDIYQDHALYQRTAALKPADALDKLTQGDILRNFVNGGVALDEVGRARFKQLSDELTRLSNEYNDNVAHDGNNTVALTPEEAAGIDALFLGSVPRDGSGNYLFKLNYPGRDNILGYARSEAARQRFYMAFMQRGGERNITILDVLSQKRREQAQLLGKESFAAWTLEDRMAGTPAAVNDFLAEVGGKVAPLEEAEVAELTRLKRQETGDVAARLQRWDVSYYQNQLKQQQYALDQSEVRRQFPTRGAVDWLLLVSSRLYGVTFKPNLKLPLWHPDVRAFDVFEQDGKRAYLGTFYMDLFPRDDKYGHAAAWGVRGVSTRLKVTPVSVLVTNFDRNGLSTDELKTLFHEFGHVLHGVLSKTRYSFHAGTSVKRDFVEAPSQMYEEWSRRPEVVRLLPEACATCKPVDPALVDKIRAANLYGAGSLYGRQVMLSAFDMSLVGKERQEPMASWRALETASPLGYVDGALFPASFGHLAGGYASGYYGYMWSQVLALDMRSAYGNNFMDPVVGGKYRKLVLERGGEVSPTEMVTSFLGRAPNSKAFFDQFQSPPAH